eukprot:TRINITY_DN120954_c0_g1_i1.p1 TRINITY_DN120954_c0_g1~~TRINITY_DN120954_c0_g1_i1.p1  ORF type:complete len:258 (-),score=43.14 TRINITY_DN120954_c0_g1_i1:155-928(-)
MANFTMSGVKIAVPRQPTPGGPKDPFYRQKNVELSFNDQPHLARCQLERFDLAEQVKGIRKDEDRLFRTKLGVREPPPTDTVRGCPFVCKQRQRREPQIMRAMTLTTINPDVPVENEEEAAARRQKARQANRPGFNFNFPKDPTTLPNDHEPRVEHMQRLINRQEKVVQQAKADSAQLSKAHSEGSLGGSEARAPIVFEYDRGPGAFPTETQRNYFPRSLDALYRLGGGKEPKALRPIDDFWHWREARIRQKACARF